MKSSSLFKQSAKSIVRGFLGGSVGTHKRFERLFLGDLVA